MNIDLISIAFVISCIVFPLPVGIILALACGMLKETMSTVPYGTYICCNLMFVLFLAVAKEHLIWRRFTPWLISVNALFVLIFFIKLILFLKLEILDWREIVWPLVSQTLASSVIGSLIIYLFYLRQKATLKW